MTSQVAAYTPLESLLLFQALRNGGVDLGSFSRISEELQNVALVREDPSYNAARLSPDALRQLYLDLLKDEARRDLETLTNGDPTTSRKRKAPSPKLPTINEAAKHSHLIPQLITRLYSRYRDITITRVREQEARYEAGNKEIGEIKSGRWDKRLQERNVQPTQTSSELMASTKPEVEKENVLKAQNMLPTQMAVKRQDVRAHPPVRLDEQLQAASANLYAGQIAQTQAVDQIKSSVSPRPSPTPAAAATPPSILAAQLGQTYHPKLQPNIKAQPQGQYVRPQTQVIQPQYQQGQAMTPVQQQQYQPQSAPSLPLQPTPRDRKPQLKPLTYSQHTQIAARAPSTVPRPQPLQQINMADVLRALATPSRQLRQPVWKTEDVPAHDTPGSPKRPPVELLSPVMARAPSPLRRTQSTRTRRQKREESSTVSEVGSAQHARSVSVGSTTADETHYTRRRIKHEPSTPFIADSEEPELQPAMSIVTRKRRGTLQTQTSILSRRRTQQVDDHDEPPPRPSTVLATRNFAKMSGVIMNEIVSHKHGSRFAQPVREKDADGYSSFIKRPQDLKSIRGAITQGARAITAATTSVAESPSAAPPTPGGSKSQENVVELERTAELMPPKAIVNGAQLEKEIMRMFANAVMFNPGEDGMVAATREMFEDVEAKIADWRGAERDLGEAAEEEDEGRVKRRKL